MTAWTPKLREGVDLTALPLDPQEGFVLSRVDGFSDVTAISHMTGISAGDVRIILDKLAQEGAIAPHTKAKTDPKTDAGKEPKDSAAAVDADDEDMGDEEGAGEDDAFGGERGEGNYLRIYATELKPLDPDERYKMSLTISGHQLCALCWDNDPRVMRNVLDNLHSTLKHARLIAKHHRTSTGLEHLGKDPRRIRDGQIQQFLVRNPQMSEALFRKLMQSKQLLDVFKMTNNREATEKVRRSARKLFRTRFGQGPASERVSVIFKTEGRCLSQLIGLALDGKTTSLLCQRTFHSVLLVQNLGRFPGAQPNLIAHLLRQPVVRRQPQLGHILRQHPNCPSSLKGKTR